MTIGACEDLIEPVREATWIKTRDSDRSKNTRKTIRLPSRQVDESWN